MKRTNRKHVTNPYQPTAGRCHSARRVSVALGAALLAACSGGSGSSSTYGDQGEDSAAKGPCYTPFSFSESVERYGKRGTAILETEEAEPAPELVELNCMTVRNAEGKALYYAASFGNRTPDPNQFIVLTTKTYEGDGVYDTAFARWEGWGAIGSPALTLTLSDDGKHGVAEAKDGGYRIEYDCDPSDDTTPAPTEPLGEPTPGTAQVSTDRGEVFVFEGIECMTNPVSGTFDVDLAGSGGVNHAFTFHFTLPESTPGQQPSDLWFDYYRIGQKSAADGDFTMSCDDPITGSFKEKSAPYYLIGAKFACPTR